MSGNRPTHQHPSRTATLYRVAYRRTNRDPSKGYTYKVFKGEIQARAFMDRLMKPQDESTPERFRTMAPLAEVYLHFGTIRWEALDDPTGGTNLVTSEHLVQDVDGNWVEYTAILDRQEFLQQVLDRDGKLREDQTYEYEHNVHLIEGHVES